MDNKIKTFPRKFQQTVVIASVAIVILAIMRLVGNKPIRSNVTMLMMTSCRYDVIYHHFPINSQYLKTRGVGSPESRPGKVFLPKSTFSDRASKHLDDCWSCEMQDTFSRQGGGVPTRFAWSVPSSRHSLLPKTLFALYGESLLRWKRLFIRVSLECPIYKPSEDSWQLNIIL